MYILFNKSDIEMNHVSFTDLRANMASHFDRLENDRSELVVTRQNHEPVVIMPLSELEGMRETLHLLSTPANAARLLASITQLEAGEAQERNLIEP
jgi:antitoxin YefM